MSSAEEYGYINLLQDILRHGDYRQGRNGGTLSLFGRQLKFSLQAEGAPRRPIVPLLTTKRVHWKSIVVELLFFLRGETNTKYLKDHGVTIWDANAPPDGELGPIYSHGWRKFGARPTAVPQPKPALRDGVEPTYLGVANGAGKSHSPFGKTWEGMIARCYDKNAASYPHYGAKGVSVCDRWLEFAAFAEDVVKLPGYSEKIAYPEIRYVLDKDFLGDGWVYGPGTCQWITDAENIRSHETKIYTVEKDGQIFSFTSLKTFAAQQGVDPTNISDLWTGSKNAKVRHGFRLVEVRDRQPGFDQIRAVITSLKTDPYGRRHIVSAWNPAHLHLMALPPCHVLFQFYVRTSGHLDCQMYQRSADAFLGLPFNIASYGLLTHIIAREVGLTPGTLTLALGDVHLYENHIAQAQEQVKRRPGVFPVLRMVERPGAFQALLDRAPDTYTFEDFTLEGYHPAPAIKAPVSA